MTSEVTGENASALESQPITKYPEEIIAQGIHSR